MGGFFFSSRPQYDSEVYYIRMDNSDLLTEKQLERAVWYVAHKALLKKIGLGALIAFDVITLGYGLFGLLNYFLFSWNTDLALRRDLAKLHFSHELVQSLGPKSLAIGSVDIFVSGAGRYDFLTKLQNPNADWYATFRYHYVTSGSEATPDVSGFILPAEEKYVAQLAQPTKTVPNRADFQLVDLQWHRVDRHAIANYAAWNKDRINFQVTNVTHTAALNIGPLAGRTSFDVDNRSAFGYWRVGFFVVLLRGTAPAAVNYITLDNLDSNEHRHVDVNWFEQLAGSSSVDIRPEVNIFDPDVYMPPKLQ